MTVVEIEQWKERFLRGTPLAIRHTVANRHETTQLEAMVDTIPTIRRPRGRPRRRPTKLHADKAYDSRANRERLRKRGITLWIARRRIESRERLGRHRWVVERTFVWLDQNRRLSKDDEYLPQTSETLMYIAISRLMLRRLVQ